MSIPPNRNRSSVYRCCHLLLVGDVADHAHGFVALGGDGGGALIGHFLADVDADEVSALTGQFLGDAAHDVGAGAGNQGRFCLRVSNVNLHRVE